MKIDKVPGEFYFRALVNGQIKDVYFPTKEEALSYFDGYAPHLIKWPIEVYEDGTVYIPSPEELNA